MTIFFTSDTHFCEPGMNSYSRRPFKSVEEHDAELVKNWNSVVKPTDTVYHLGDIALASSWKTRRPQKILKQLNGIIHLIRGNHDRKIPKGGLERFASVQDYLYFEHKPRNKPRRYITLCHFPMWDWQGSHRGSWQLHGHCHHGKGMRQSPPKRGKQLDVGVDGHWYSPISFEEVEAKLEPAKPKVFNQIHDEIICSVEDAPKIAAAVIAKSVVGKPRTRTVKCDCWYGRNGGKQRGNRHPFGFHCHICDDYGLVTTDNFQVPVEPDVSASPDWHELRNYEEPKKTARQVSRGWKASDWRLP